MKPDTLRVEWRDLNGREALNSLHLPHGTSDATAIVGMSKLVELSLAVQARGLLERDLVEFDGDNGSSGPYATHRDMARLRFETAGTGQVQISIPAPKASCFKDDNETVDPADPDVAALITWLLANAKDNAGNALTHFAGGERWFFNE